MIWTVLKVIGVVLLIFVAYVAWVLFRASGNLGESPTAHAEILTDSLRAALACKGHDIERNNGKGEPGQRGDGQ